MAKNKQDENNVVVVPLENKSSIREIKKNKQSYLEQSIYLPIDKLVSNVNDKEEMEFAANMAIEANHKAHFYLGKYESCPTRLIQLQIVREIIYISAVLPIFFIRILYLRMKERQSSKIYLKTFGLISGYFVFLSLGNSLKIHKENTYLMGDILKNSDPDKYEKYKAFKKKNNYDS